MDASFLIGVFLVFLFVSDNANLRFSGVFFCIGNNAQTCLNMATTNLGVVLFALPYSFRHVFFSYFWLVTGGSNPNFDHDRATVFLDEVL